MSMMRTTSSCLRHAFAAGWRQALVLLLALAMGNAVSGEVVTERHDARGRLQGERRIESPDGTVLLREHYRDDVRHGLYELYFLDHDSGVATLVSRGRYRDGRRVGAWVVGDHRSGSRAEGRYRNDRQVGLWRTLDAHGYVQRITSFGNDGEPHGRTYVFERNGALQYYQDLRRGVPHGDTVYYADGNPEYRVRYERGERVEETSSTDSPDM